MNQTEIPITQYVKYSIKLSSIPPELQLSPTIIELSQKKIEINNFELELDLLDKYTDIKKTDTVLQRPEWLTNQLSQASLGSQPQQQTTASTTMMSGRNGSFLNLDDSVSSKKAISTVQDNDELVMEMIKRIDNKLDIDTCRFLLESSDWNLDTAIDLFRSTY